MSAAAAAETTPAPAKGKKKLLIIVIAAVLVLAIGGGAALFLLKKKPAEGEGDEEGHDAPPAKAVKHDPKAVPIFVPLDPFTVNLADKEADRYAQVGITLEIVDSHVGEQLKQFMPAVRHAILMILAEKSAAMLLDREGKTKLAREVQRETSRVLGAEVPDEEEEAGAGHDEPPKKGAKKKAKKRAPPELPIRAVNFSNFIIQ